MSELRQPLLASRSSIVRYDEFFASGMEESISPFLTPKSQGWGKNLPLKGSILAAFLLLGAFIAHFVPSQHNLSNQLLLLTYFFAGTPALIGALEDLLAFEINIDILMTLAAFGSILIGSGMEGALLLVLFSLSGSMEQAVRARAKGAITALQELAPTKAWILDDTGELFERSVHDVKLGMRLLVKAGQVVPLDGKIIDGISTVNLVHLTGENQPIPKKAGDTVPAGARNLEGALTVEVTHTSGDSTLARIIALITSAQEAKPRLQRWLDTISHRYAISIILLSLLFAVTLPWFTTLPYLGTEGALYRALTFLIAASPCALIIAIPIAYLSAISSCARKGVLLKGGIILDALARCSHIALDKTGTVTEGTLTCVEAEGMDGDALRLAYALEQNAVHPIAHAICAYAKEKGATPLRVESFRNVPGYGIEGTYQGKAVKIGNVEWIEPTPEIVKKIVSIEEKGEIYTLFSWGERVHLFHFKDQVRPGIGATLAELKRRGVTSTMLTGDHRASAEAVAKEAGITDVQAELRPEDKLAWIGEMAQKTSLAMVGDGINDAPALARATVGISMGKVGSHTAVDASDIVLLQDNIELLGWLFEKAQKTVRIVKENVLLAGGVILLATIPALLGWVPLWLAVILHEGGTVVVGLNALRLLKR